VPPPMPFVLPQWWGKSICGTRNRTEGRNHEVVRSRLKGEAIPSAPAINIFYRETDSAEAVAGPCNYSTNDY